MKMIKNQIKKLFKKYPFLRRVYWFWFVRIPFFIRIQKPLTNLFGPKYQRSRKFIEIDITYDCNLKCINCNRSCRQAPSKESMTVGQIQKFVDESIKNNIKWERIRVLGGEPTLHPDLFKILTVLLRYKKDFSLDTNLELITNGFGERVKKVLSKIPEGVNINSSEKETTVNLFFPFNIAPKDSVLFRFADYSNGCATVCDCGMGLTPYGYYPCAVAGGIDRVFGFNIGRKNIPSLDDSMTDQLKIFCKLCGQFGGGKAKRIDKELNSKSWKEVYERYKKRKPSLSLY